MFILATDSATIINQGDLAVIILRDVIDLTDTRYKVLPICPDRSAPKQAKVIGMGSQLTCPKNQRAWKRWVLKLGKTKWFMKKRHASKILRWAVRRQDVGSFSQVTLSRLSIMKIDTSCSDKIMKMTFVRVALTNAPKLCNFHLIYSAFQAVDEMGSNWADTSTRGRKLTIKNKFQRESHVCSQRLPKLQILPKVENNESVMPARGK